MTTSRTLLTGVRKINLEYFDTTFLGFVLDIFVQPSERPDVEFLGVRETGANVGQFLEGDDFTSMILCLLNNLLGKSVEVVIRPSSFPITHRLDRSMR